MSLKSISYLITSDVASPCLQAGVPCFPGMCTPGPQHSCPSDLALPTPGSKGESSSLAGTLCDSSGSGLFPCNLLLSQSVSSGLGIMSFLWWAVCPCISLHPFWHLGATARWVGLDLLAVGLLWQLERWLIASKAELAGVSHCSPRSAWFNMASFCGCFGSILCSLQPRRMWKWRDASIILTALHPPEHQLTDLKL